MAGEKNKNESALLPKTWSRKGAKRRRKKIEERSAQSAEIVESLDPSSADVGLDRPCPCETCLQVGQSSSPAVPHHIKRDQPEFVSSDAPIRPENNQTRERSDGPSDEERMCVNVCGIRFSRASRIYHFDTGGLELRQGDWVIVKTEKGTSLGQVALPPFDMELEPSQLEGLRRVLRKAGRTDFDQLERCRQREKEAFAYCLERIEALGLSMKLVAAECFFDSSKYVFYFTAEGRVDFRELVKQLVARFPVRIEMRQIGVRHEAKMIGGLGTCGQELCCARFLTDFRPVSVRMAKTQNLSLNPTKISGVCGRLMCCLGYEHDIYEEFKRGLPKIGKRVKTAKGEGVVIKQNPLTETVLLQVDEETTLEVRREDVVDGLSGYWGFEDDDPEINDSLDDEDPFEGES
jgi:cell fate regulator YaaT (PSP1 superfamily)